MIDPAIETSFKDYLVTLSDLKEKLVKERLQKLDLLCTPIGTLRSSMVIDDLRLREKALDELAQVETKITLLEKVIKKINQEIKKWK